MSKGASRVSIKLSSNALGPWGLASAAAAVSSASAAEARASPLAMPAEACVHAGRFRANTRTARVPSSSEPSLLDASPSSRAASCTAARSSESNPRNVGPSVGGPSAPAFATRSANASTSARQPNGALIDAIESTPSALQHSRAPSI